MFKINHTYDNMNNSVPLFQGDPLSITLLTSGFSYMTGQQQIGISSK